MELRENIDFVLSMFAPDFDWNAYYEAYNDGPDDFFRECCFIGLSDKDYYECGSTKLEDTPKALYRLLYLLNPEKLSFEDMYKGELFHFFSADKRFFVTVDFFKYKLGLYFYCLKEDFESEPRFVTLGQPGADNGTRCTNPDGLAFFEMIKQAANHTWMVYPGNDFEV